MGQISLHKFYFDVARQAKSNPTLRYGQVMSNRLFTVRPDLSEQVLGSDMDPFYSVSPTTDPKFKRFIAFIEANWSKCGFCQKDDHLGRQRERPECDAKVP